MNATTGGAEEAVLAVANNYRFLTFINSSVVEQIGWRFPLQMVYSFEVFLLCTNFLEYLFNLYLLLRIRAMHCNLHILLLLYGGQYFFSMLSRLLLVYHQFIGTDSDPSPDSSTLASLVYLANYTRTICLFVAFNMLPFLVFERCFATCYAGTYENDRHFWIPLLLIGVMMPVSVLSAVAYIRNWFPIYAHCILLIVLNIGGSVLLIIITKCNIRLHNSYSTLEHHRFYSLSERFQVSENLKTCQWLSRIQGSILFFNVACASILILEYISMRNDKVVIVVNVSFNIMCTLYAAIVPIVVISYTPEWSRETKRLWNLVSFRTSREGVNLRTTFGEEMSYSDKNIESKVYFDQLQKTLTRQAMEKLRKKQRSSSWNNSEHEIFL